MNQWKKQKYYDKWKKHHERKRRPDPTLFFGTRRDIKTLKVVEIIGRKEADLPPYFIKERIARKLAEGIIDYHLFNYKVEKDYIKIGDKITAWVDVVEPSERW